MHDVIKCDRRLARRLALSDNGQQMQMCASVNLPDSIALNSSDIGIEVDASVLNTPIKCLPRIHVGGLLLLLSLSMIPLFFSLKNL